MTIFYYTATGNSLAVVKHIGGTPISIPQIVDADDLHYKDDAIGIVFPLHWWSPNALHMKNEKSGKRWRNPDVSLDEIIKANNRNVGSEK